MNIKRNIIFSLESRKKNGVPIVENVPIRMRVIFASQRIEFTTGYRIDAAKWDTDKQRVKPGCTNKLKQSASEINTDLLRYYTEIQNIFKEFEVQGTMPTTAQVKEAFNNLHSEKREEEQQKPLTFAPMEVFGEFIKECGTQNGWSDATYEKFAAVRKHLEKFDKELTFEALDEPKLTSYVNFLKDVEGLRNTSTMKQIAYLKWFLRWSFKKGHNQNMAYDSFKPKLKNTPKKVIFLTWEELNRLKDYKIPPTKQYLERVRDVFLFCCFSGLRYSDVYNLKRSDIKPDHIEVTTVKTADSLIIELNNHSKAILDKSKACTLKTIRHSGHQQSEDERLFERTGRACGNQRPGKGNLLQRKRTHRHRHTQIRPAGNPCRKTDIHLQRFGIGHPRTSGDEMDGAQRLQGDEALHRHSR